MARSKLKGDKLALSFRAGKREVIHVASTDGAFLMNMLEKPPAPNARLRKAFRTYKKRTIDAEHSSFNWSPRPKRGRARKRAA